MRLRDYQLYAVNSIFDYFASGGRGNPIVVMPTGTGKSVVLGEFIRRACMTYPGTRIMKLTHVKELIEQNLDKFLKLWPGAPAGVFSSGLKRKDVGFPIVFGGVGTVARATAELFGRMDLLLIDECHLVSPKESTMYQRIIEGLKKINPQLKVIGFTATHYRLGFGLLTEPGGLFTDVCCNMSKLESFNWFIEQGYLVPLIPKRPGLELDVSGVHIHGGEFKQDELQLAVDREEITRAAVNEIIAWGRNTDRRHWLIFSSGIEHALHIAEMLCSLGIAATCVHSNMKDAERDANIKGFLTGKYQAIVNNGILTTGFDFPGIDLIGVLRPTQSAGLWVQMLGRGTRPVFASGFNLETLTGRLEAIATGPKQDCLVLDFAGNTRRLGPINDPVLPRRKGQKGGGAAPIKICPVDGCGTYNHASARFCCACKTEFARGVKIREAASTDELIAQKAADEIVTKVFKVDRITYSEYRKEGKPPSIQVAYYCGLRMFKEWVSLEHEGYPSKKARDWWRERANAEPPETTHEALKQLDLLAEPSHIRVWLKRPYDEIKNYDFSGTGFNGAEK